MAAALSSAAVGAAGHAHQSGRRRRACSAAARCWRRCSRCFYGAGNGILTIARGTLPLALFGPQGFGRRVGMISLPARATGALAPLAVGLMAEHIGTATLWVSAARVAFGFHRVADVAPWPGHLTTPPAPLGGFRQGPFTLHLPVI